jgi:uncharacterized protein (TIGR00725 family)
MTQRWPSIMVAVVGKGRDCPPAVYHLAFQVGTLIGAHPELLLVTGGLGGAMEGAARGAKQSGGRVLGLLPGRHSRGTEVFAGADLQLDTGLSANGRNIVLASAVSAMVAVPGSHGSLQEMIIAVDADKPVWAVGQHRTRLPGVDYLRGLDELAARLNSLVHARNP